MRDAALDDHWQTPPPHLTLGDRDVHLWRASLTLSAGDIEPLTHTLSSDELARANRFHFQHHRHAFIVARGILRHILSRYLGIPAGEIEFAYGDRGKPCLKSAASPSLCFNLSHSQDYALYAVTRDRPIGVDLEYLRPLPDAERLAQRFFTTSEYADLLSVPPPQRQRLFFEIWTCKEAYLKATGEGLGGLQNIEVSLQGSQLTLVKPPPPPASSWSLQPIKMGDRYAAALAVNLPSFTSRAFCVDGAALEA